MIKDYYGSLYGNYRQNSFADVFGDVDTFLTDYQSNGIKTTISVDSCTTLYYLLYAQYGNDIISSSDTNRFKYQLFSIIFAYGPTWEKRLDIQEKLRGLNDTDLFAGSTQINNQALNPGTAPTTNTTSELTAISQQVVTKYKKDKMTGYNMLLQLLDTDVTMEFIKKFDRLFLKVVQPENPLYYITEGVEV